MRTTTVLFTVLGLGLATLFSATSTARAQDETSGTFTLESTSIAIGMGVSWGQGVLEYRGQKYPFTVKGPNVMDLGVSKVTTRGRVQNLNKLEDFGGSYVLAGPGAAAGSSTRGAALKNQNGVELALSTTGQGVRLLLAQGGLDVRLPR